MSGPGPGGGADLRRWWEDRRLVPLLLVLAVLVTYLPAVFGAGFHFDDHHSLRDNPSVRTLANIPRFYVDPKLWSAEPGNVMYRPTLLATFALDHAVWGYRAAGWILTNVLLHGAVAALVWRLALRLGLSPLASMFAGTVTALHPVHSEVLNYASSRSESLAALWMLLALHAHLSMRAAAGARRAAWLAATCVLFALGLTTKETCALFWLAAPLLDVILPAHGTPSGPVARIRAASGPAVAYLLVFVGAMLLRRELVGHATAAVSLLTSTGADPRTGGQVSIVENVLKTQSRVVVLYYDLLARPVRLTLDHDVERTLAWLPSACVSLAIHAAIVGAAVHAWTRGRRLFPLCALWFWMFLAPSVAFPLNVVMNEHRLYLPGIAVSLAAGACLARVTELLPRGRRWLVAMPFVLFAALAAHRSFEWRDDLVLWRRGIERAPHSDRAWLHLGAAIHNTRDLGSPPEEQAEVLDEAIRHYERSREIFPNSFDANLNLGLAWLEHGRLTGDGAEFERSLAAYREAERTIGGEVTRTRLCRALVLTELSRCDEAEAIIARARADDPASRTTIYDDMLARTLRKRGDRAGAEVAILRVIAIEEPELRVDGLLALAGWRFEDGELPGTRDLLDRAMVATKTALRTGAAEATPRPFLQAARVLNLLGYPGADAFLADARALGWSAPADEVRWVQGGRTPGVGRAGAPRGPR